MKNLIFCLLLIFIISSCDSKKVNSFKEKIVNSSAPVISTLFECENTDEIKKDLNHFLKVEEPKKEQTFPLGTLCRLILNQGIPIIIDKGIPKDWECKNNNVENAIQLISARVCAII